MSAEQKQKKPNSKFPSSTSQINEYKYLNVKHRTLIGKIFYDNKNAREKASRCLAQKPIAIHVLAQTFFSGSLDGLRVE